MSEIQELRHEWRSSRPGGSLGEARSFLLSAKTVGELKVLTAQRDGCRRRRLRKMGDFLRDKEPGVVAVLAAVNDGKITLPGRLRQGRRGQGREGRRYHQGQSPPSAAARAAASLTAPWAAARRCCKVDDALAAVDDFVAGKL